MSPMMSSWMGEMRPSKAPMLIRTLAAAISAPIRLASDNLIAERGRKKFKMGKV